MIADGQSSDDDRIWLMVLDPRVAAGSGDLLGPIITALNHTRILVAVTPSCPPNLADLLTRQGYYADTTKLDDGRCLIWVQAKDVPVVLDVRECEAPEPFERIMAAVEELEKGGAMVARTPRLPRPLVGRLGVRPDVAVEANELADGTGVVIVTK